jgi:plastocyanin
VTIRRIHRVFGASTLILAALLLGACGGGSDDGDSAATDSGATTPGDDGDGATVVLEDIVFKPKRITIEVGETVLWQFKDKGIKHNVVAEDRSFKSATKDTGNYRRTFRAAGTYPYVCTLHPGMTGTVVVTAAVSDDTTSTSTSTSTTTTSTTTGAGTGY